MIIEPQATPPQDTGRLMNLFVAVHILADVEFMSCSSRGLSVRQDTSMNTTCHKRYVEGLMTKDSSGGETIQLTAGKYLRGGASR